MIDPAAEIAGDQPQVAPIRQVRLPAISATVSAMREPQISRLSTSRPRLSVPR